MNLAFLQKNTDTHNMNNTVSALIGLVERGQAEIGGTGAEQAGKQQ